MLAGVLTTLLSFAEVRAQGVQQKNMDRMPGMGGTKQETMASATGTVTAVNTADRKKRGRPGDRKASKRK
jgi:predicted lipoprotein